MNELLGKLNVNGSFFSLYDIASQSFQSFRAFSQEKLSYSESKALYAAARQNAKDNKIFESRLFARANPQLSKALHLGVKQLPQQRDYNNDFGNRASYYAAPGSVASMFSPAAYLTEMYREARHLHTVDNANSLAVRRPDLALLPLSQTNLDDEITTLALSNEIISTAITHRDNIDIAVLPENLSTRCYGVNVPFHQYYETVRQGILQQDPLLQAFTRAPALQALIDLPTLLAVQAGISPELYNILTEDISKNTDIDMLFTKNFGMLTSETLSDINHFVADYYEITQDELKEYNQVFFSGEKNDDDVCVKQFLLSTNKIIRLHKATGLSLDNIKRIINSYAPDNNMITADILNTLLSVIYLSRRYRIPVEKALVLSNRPVSQQSVAGQASEFTRLFNTPPLNGVVLVPDGNNDNPIHVVPDKLDDTDTRRAILKRSWQVNDSELYLLHKIDGPESTLGILCDVNHLSNSYRIKLLADIHDLSVTELYQLLQISPYKQTALSTVNAGTILEIIQFVYSVTEWLKTKNMTVSQLFILATSDYSTVLTPEITTLLQTLKDGMTGSSELKGSDLINALSPFIAGALKLDSNQQAVNLLTWVSKTMPTGMMLNDFWAAVGKNGKNGTVVQFCHALAQYALIIRTFSLSTAEMNLVLTGTYIPGHDIVSLMSLSRFHEWVGRCGNRATEVLAALSAGTLSVSTLASALNIDESMMQQALAQLSTKASTDNIISWQQIEVLMQWLDMAGTLKLTPDGVATLLNINFDYSHFADWKNLSDGILAALDRISHDAVVNRVDEMRSSALCSYYSGNKLISRGDLYAQFLIDNQVSSQIKTTRIAEAIASVQLYVSRCLNGLETDVDPIARERQYFVDWDMYNKRYSTWAGVSELIYYPENYIDPAMRIGQTKMMDTLLQSISQSGINTDTVGDAFVTYLTSFEQVANLDVVSGYHDGVDVNQRMTYFIGHNNSAPTDYYWRSADQSKRKQGDMAANAWTEWTKVNLGMNPYHNLVRPVVFNDRLNIVWVERSTIQNGRASARADASATRFVYTLKLSHLRYDGSWSTPLSFDVSASIDAITKKAKVTSAADLEAFIPGLYSAREVNGEKDTFRVVLYEIRDVYPPLKNNFTLEQTNFSLLFLSDDMKLEIYSGGMLDQNYNNIRGFLSPSKKNIVIGQYGNIYAIDAGMHSLYHNKENNYFSFTGGEVSRNTISGDSQTYSITTHVNITLYSNKITPDIPDRVLNAVNINDVSSYYVNPYLALSLLHLDVPYAFITKSELVVVVKPVGVSLNADAINSSAEIDIDNKGVLVAISDEMSKEKLQVFRQKITTQQQMSSLLSAQKITVVKYGTSWGVTRDLHWEELSSENDINDIKLVLSSGYKQKVFGFSEWSDTLPLNVKHGENTFSSKKLSLDNCESKELYNGTGEFNVSIQAMNANGNTLLDSYFNCAKIIHLSDKKIIIHKNDRNAQYMEVDGNNIRLNTLFARKLISRANRSIESVLHWDTQNIQEPALVDSGDVFMDFGGANALYFWELFYYTPMLVALRFFQEQRFKEAETWLQYVYNPKGYITGDTSRRYWNVRPLALDITWNNDPLDSVDPDAVAQNDPMHYKVSTFMRYLDMLMARGDAAYRVLERDSLNEAKMWYTQTLAMLGNEPWESESSWLNPVLAHAADETMQTTQQSRLTALRTATAIPQPYTANSVTALFFPQTNEKLHGYWQTLAQRLYNLRHNLSIDGQPLSLPVYAAAADPQALLSAAVLASEDGRELSASVMPLYRFPVILDSARAMVGLLTQFGATLQGIIERQDAEALNELLQSQGHELMLTSLKLQDQAIAEVDSDIAALNAARDGAQQRGSSYQRLYDENISAMEQRAMDIRMGAAITNATASGAYIAEGVADTFPNIFGLSDGGSRWGGIPHAVGVEIQLVAEGMTIEADKISASESYRRRREEWGIQRDQALSEVKQIDSQLQSLSVRRTAAVMQKDYLTTQQQQLQAQQAFLQSKFSNSTLYNWLRGKLAAIYYQFYDLTVSRCLMAEKAWQWELSDSATTFIRPGAWSGTYAGLMAGETLQLSLAQMEDAWLKKDTRVLEITRTVSLADVYASLGDNKFVLADILADSMRSPAGTNRNGVKVVQNQLLATFTLADLNIASDYPKALGDTRRLKQVSVSLPALLGPYQDIRAVLNYGGSLAMPRGCKSVAISHGMNDSGQFQLDFNDSRWLPFEGIPVDDEGTFTLSFPLDERQKPVLQSLTDIIVHIRYTIRNTAN